MKSSIRTLLASLPLLLCVAIPAGATQINFTGGTATMTDGSTGVTNNSAAYGNVDYYEQGGFRLDNIGGDGYTGDYYSAGNDVIHSHWAAGNFGTVTMIKVTKNDATDFDLNYFVLTSNTDTGGSFASGNERAFIHASADGVSSSFSMLLPTEDWGFPATQIHLGSQFDNIKAFWFTVDNSVDCFGMDNFFIDEQAPGLVSEPGTLALLGFGLIGLIHRRRSAPPKR